MSQVTLLTGPERRRRWSAEDQRQILAAAFAPGASVTEVSRRYDVATSLIYKWRRQILPEHKPCFAEVVVAPADAEAMPATIAMVEIEIAGKVRVRIPATTPPALATAIVKGLRAS